MRPSTPDLHQADSPLDGFTWAIDGHPTSLATLVADPLRPAGALLKAHLDALDAVLMASARRLGMVLGGGRPPTSAEETDLATLHRSLDRLVHDYAAARVDHRGRR